MISGTQAPVLHKIDDKENTKTVTLLSSIDTRLEEVSKSILSRKTDRIQRIKETQTTDRIENIVKKIETRGRPLGSKNRAKQLAKTETQEAIITSSTGNAEITGPVVDTPNERKARKEDRDQQESMFSKLFGKLGGDLKKGTNELVGGVAKGFLGPLNLAIEPLAETFGVKFDDLFGFEAKKKDRPPQYGKTAKAKKADMMKYFPFAQYIVDKLGGKKDEQGDKKGGLLGGLLGGLGASTLASKLFPALMKALPIAAIAGGILWSVIDAIVAVGKAKEWGVSKLAAGIGGFFGGTGSGFISAFAMAGKWALVGAGVGFLAAGPVGALAGGLIGAAVGALIGYIGGENIAKGIQASLNNFSKMWKGDLIDKTLGMASVLTSSINTMIVALSNVIPNMIADIFVKDPSKNAEIKTKTKEISKWIWRVTTLGVFDTINSVYLAVKSIFSKGDKKKEAKAAFAKQFKETNLAYNLYKAILTPLSNLGSKVFEFLHLDDFVAIISKVGKKALDGVVAFGKWFSKFFMLEEIASFIKNGISNAFKKVINIGKWINSSIFVPIGQFFQKAIKGISSGFLSMGSWISSNVMAPMGLFFTNAWSKIKDAGTWVKDAILSPVTAFFSGAFSKVKDIGAWAVDNILAPMGAFVSKMFGKAIDTTSALFSKYVVSPIENMFKFIGDMFGFLASGDINIMDIIKGVTKGGKEDLDEKFKTYKSNKEYDEVSKTKEFQSWAEKQSKNKEVYAATKDKDSKKLLDLYKASIVPVNDAIITPSGRIITPSPEDTIIATKSPVKRENFDSKNMQFDLTQISKSIETSSKGDDIVSAINKLIATIKEKPFNNVVQNNTTTNTDFDRLRYAY